MVIPKKIAKGFLLLFLFAIALPFVLAKLGFGRLIKSIVNDNRASISDSGLIHKASADVPSSGGGDDGSSETCSCAGDESCACGS